MFYLSVCILGGNPFVDNWDEDDDEEEDQYGDMKKASVRTLELMEEIADGFDDQNRLTSRSRSNIFNVENDRVLKKVGNLSSEIKDLKKTCELQMKTIEKLMEKLDK